ncbi:MAG: CxxC-x17-CxxC domain-containing protein [Candidatus Omnitrophota bacterium]
MKKRFKRKSLLVAPQDESGVAGLINKVQQQLSAMEKKLDILISQSLKRPFEKSYSQKPFRRFDHSHRHDRGIQGNGPREKTYTRVICADCNKECEIPFKPSGDRPVYCKECFLKRKGDSSFKENYDSKSREGDFVQGRHFDRQRGGENRSSEKKKKSIFRRRKERI